MKTQIILCGDLCPTPDTEAHFKSEDEQKIFTDCLPLFENADLVVGNLEFVLTDDPNPIQKSGPILYGATKYIKVLKKAGFHLLSVANNHIKDCGEKGVMSTLKTCAHAEIDTFGAARNLEEAKKPFIKEINGIKVGFLTFAEQEFNTAGGNEYGANYFDPYEDLDLISVTKKMVDHLIVIYHGGIEYYEYPSPLLQKKCRRFVDKGADLVTCQHSHCIGTIEEYLDRNIIYGQGNTVFGYREGNDSWNQGLILELHLDDENLKMQYRGITATKEGGIRLMTAEEQLQLTSTLKLRSLQVDDKGFIKESWLKFCKTRESIYLPQYLGLNRYLIHLNRWTNNRIISSLFRKKYLRSSHNIMRCESHNEVIQTILKKKLNS